MKEQQFFKDPAIDRLMGMVMALAAELYILRDRNQALEEVLESTGLLTPGAIENHRPAASRESQTAERDAFIARLMEPLTGASEGRYMAQVDEELVANLTRG